METQIEKYPTRRRSAQIGTCPSCSHEIKLSGRILIGMELICPGCGDQLQVVELEPITLDWLYDYDSEYDDFDDDDW